MRSARNAASLRGTFTMLIQVNASYRSEVDGFEVFSRNRRLSRPDTARLVTDDLTVFPKATRRTP
jgi:hypothetical protein